MRNLSMVLSASGKRGCSFVGGLAILFQAPETGHHSGEGRGWSAGTAQIKG